MDWVEAGGLLVAVANSVYDHETESSRDPLLDRLGVFLLDPFEDEDEDEAEEDEAAAESGEPNETQSDAREADEEAAADAVAEDGEAADDAPETFGEVLVEVFDPVDCATDEASLEAISVGDPEGRPARVELFGPYELAVYEERLDDAYLSPRGRLLSLPVGEGRVLAMTSVEPFRNARIACHDHAWLLWFMIEGARTVHLLHDPAVPSLTDLATAHFPIAWWGGLALLLVAAASDSLRFGRAEPIRDERRRSHLEHLEATVAFRHAKGGFARLFQRLVRDLHEDAPKDRAKWAARAGIDEDRMRAALGDDVPRSRREILERTTTLLTLRRTR